MGRQRGKKAIVGLHREFSALAWNLHMGHQSDRDKILGGKSSHRHRPVSLLGRWDKSVIECRTSTIGALERVTHSSVSIVEGLREAGTLEWGLRSGFAE